MDRNMQQPGGGSHNHHHHQQQHNDSLFPQQQQQQHEQHQYEQQKDYQPQQYQQEEYQPQQYQQEHYRRQQEQQERQQQQQQQQHYRYNGDNYHEEDGHLQTRTLQSHDSLQSQEEVQQQHHHHRIHHHHHQQQQQQQQQQQNVGRNNEDDGKIMEYEGEGEDEDEDEDEDDGMSSGEISNDVFGDEYDDEDDDNNNKERNGHDGTTMYADQTLLTTEQMGVVLNFTLFFCILLFIGIVLGVALEVTGKSNPKEDEYIGDYYGPYGSSSGSTTSTTTASGNDGSKHIQDQRRLKQVREYLIHENIVDFRSLNYENSAQSLAANWIATMDAARIPIPKLTQNNNNNNNNNNNANIHIDVVGFEFLPRYIMALFFYEMNGSGWTHDLNFLSHSPVCHWFQLIIYIDQDDIDQSNLQDVQYIQQLITNNDVKPIGISCDANYKIDGLFLDSNNMTGTLPTELALLSNLQVLNFDFNQIIGPIPPAFVKLTNLHTLYMGHNSIWGSLPTWMSSLPELQNLVLDHNLFVGTIPQEYKDLSNLQTLAIDDNFISGSITHVFNQDYQSTIKYLLLEDNFLTGQINDSFLYGMTLLQILDLSNNQFHGYIPEHFFSQGISQNLHVIDIHQNNLTGFHEGRSDNFGLQFISLQNNLIIGGHNITVSLRVLRGLKHLDLSNNLLTQIPIPADLDTIANEDLQDDWLMGFIDDVDDIDTTTTASSIANENGQQQQLEYLFLANNPFIPGTIPSELLYLSNSLQELSLKNTQRTGTIPNFMGEQLHQLIFLDLDNNALSGTIPSQLGLLSDTLQFLLLNRNQFNQTIPMSLANLTNLRLAFWDTNELTGSMDALFCDGKEKIGNAFGSDLPYMIADCMSEIQCSCCDKCCSDSVFDHTNPNNQQHFGDEYYNQPFCNKNDAVASVLPQWQLGYNRTFYMFGDRVQFFANVQEDP